MLLKENILGKEAIYKTEVKTNMAKDYFYASFICDHPSLNSYSDKYNGELYNGDACEIFITAKDIHQYYEIEVAPNGCVFLAKITNDGINFNGKLLKTNFVKTESKIVDDKWIVNIKIPLKRIGYDRKSSIKYNLYRIETDGIETNRHLFSLNPTLCNSFHKIDAFIEYKKSHD